MARLKKGEDRDGKADIVAALVLDPSLAEHRLQ
jgi:hypothetical protein